MPSGKTHDAVTFLFIVPVFAVAYLFTREYVLPSVVATAFLFGGIMFGPDLDTLSQQYSRWGTFRFLWLPYQKFFPHRSRWSHGLVFGTFFRVVYFAGAATVITFIAAYILAVYRGGDLPRMAEFADAWRSIGTSVRSNFGDHSIAAAFIGVWLGAASHTLTDMAGSFVRTGRIGEYL
ncbi:MAG: metal-binding protein [Acidobacteria bacterium]|nr:metal-binding protein [Acidobacteriota bacterium]MBK8148662.1 metal-binding protein [Acidobacteriota bacterium]MBK8810293.1 metal-binding protein [Acidobacteriota bacterium]